MLTRTTSCSAALAAVMAVALSAPSIAGEFVQTAGPSAGDVRVLGAHGNEAWAATLYELFISSDSGATWTPGGDGIPSSVFLEQIVATDTAVYARSRSELFRSTDGGATFTAVPLGMSNIVQIELMPRGSELIVSAVRSQSPDALLRVSADGSTVDALPLPGDPVNATFASSDALVVVINNALFRSTDDGTNWQPTGEDLPADLFVRFVANDNVMILRASFANRFFRSTDSGLTWNEITPGFPLALFASPLDVVEHNSTLFASFHDNNELSIYRSTDDGLTWQPAAGADLPALVVQNSAIVPMAAAGDTVLLGFGLFGHGVYRSTDAADTWAEANNGFVATAIHAAGRVGNVLLAAAGFGSRNYRSDDFGNVWTDLDGLGPVVSYYAFDADTVLAGTFGSGAFRSIDAGQTWSPINTGLPDYVPLDGGQYEPINDMVMHNGYVFAGTGGAREFIGGDDHCGCTGTTSGDGVYRTGNGGASWQRVSNGLPINTFAYGEAILRPIDALLSVNGALLAATPAHGVYRSTNDGVNWSSTTGAPGGTDMVLFNGDVYLADGAGGLYRSTDGGQSWSIVSTDLPAGFAFRNLHVHDGTLYAASGFTQYSPSPGIYESSNAANWQPASAALAGLPVTSMTSLGDDLFVGTIGRGVWVMPGAVATPEDLNGDGSVDVFDLFQLLGAWGACPQPCPPQCIEDINGDCAVDVFDLFDLLSAWGG